MRKKICRLCRTEHLKIDYKDTEFLKQYISENAQIVPRARSGNCAKHQRQINTAIKRARVLAFLPFTR